MPSSEVVDVEVVEEEKTQEMTPVLATVQVTPAEAKAQNEQINAVISEVLKEGKDGDYWKIPGTQTPTLLQPGAETLQRFFGLGRELSDPVMSTVEIDGKHYFSALVKCSVTNASGRVLSDSFGYCDDTEAKKGGGPGSKWRGNRHTIIQIATKRAYVSAIKNATGTSNHFTADMEDSQERSQQPVVEDALASDDEKMILAGLYQQKKPGGTLEEGLEWIASFKAKGDSRAWVAKQCLNLLLRPDPPRSSVRAPSPEDLQRVGPEPELPVYDPATQSADGDPSGYGDPPIPGQTALIDDENAPPF